MKAIGRNLIISKTKEGTTKTKGGLLLAENQREDIRYVQATVISVGTEVEGVNENDIIFYDRHAGHKIEIDKKSYRVIKVQDVVVVT
jgi:co-chaperonin GroES (HSP10)|uniref:Co-chaperonin GroES n=1 Tax=uncultured virus TaxID=340016 RepID=A0A221S4E5_9VIRU|nr:co-chaperonin GroES [uncultured virus]